MGCFTEGGIMEVNLPTEEGFIPIRDIRPGIG
jgi:hypothetical protein